MKKAFLLFFVGVAFCGGIISETRYTIGSGLTQTITEDIGVKYSIQGDQALYISFAGNVPTQSWSVTSGSIMNSQDLVPAGYLVKIYAATTANVVVGKSSI